MSLLNPLSRGTMRVENPLVEWSQTSRKAVRVVNPLLFRSQTSREAVRVMNPLLFREMLDEPKAGRSNGRGLGKFLLGVVAVAVVAAGIMPLMEMLDEPSPAYDSHGNTEAPAEHQHHQTDKNNQEGGQHEESGGQEAGGSNGGDTGGEQERGDAGGQRSNNDNEDDDNDEEDDDNDEEDDDNDEEDDDNDEEDSDSTSQSTISEDVDSSSYDISDSTSQLSISEHGESSSDFSSESTLQLRTSDGEILIGLFNPRSINNKQSRISELPNRLNLSVLMLPETWVTPENGDQRLREISGDFDVFHQPRVNQEGESERRGGGVAILSSNDLRGTRVRFENTSFGSFEFVAAELQHDRWDQPLWTVTVYRPPETEQEMRKFLEEFEKLLNQFSKDDSILITGDFNIWVNDKNNKHAKRFKKLLRNNGLRQHVRGPTHNRGNTLDLVITRNVHISTARVKKPKNKTKTVIDRKTKKEKKKNITLSDHSAVIFSLRPKNPTNPQSTQSNESEE